MLHDETTTRYWAEINHMLRKDTRGGMFNDISNNKKETDKHHISIANSIAQSIYKV